MQFRLVLHSPPAVLQSASGENPSFEAHGDLFIQNGDILVTYEWPARDLPPRGDETFSRLVCAESGILLLRKADHRLHYWTHEGDVSKGRGTVAELLRGEIEMKAGFETAVYVRPAGPV